MHLKPNIWLHFLLFVSTEKSDVEDYGTLCNIMELEINRLLSPGSLEMNAEGKYYQFPCLFILIALGILTLIFNGT